MRILVDARHLTKPHLSGVGEYTTQLLRALFKINQAHDYTLLTSGSRIPDLKINLDTDKFEHVHIRLPNKLLNARMSLLGHPTLNWYVKNPVDLLFLPNLNIAPLPTDIPTVMMVHDLSWHLFPEYYSRRMLAWHKACKPEQLMREAKKLITPSQVTKQDVMRITGRKNEDISVIPHGVDNIYSAHMEARDHGVRSRLTLPKHFVLFVGTIEPRKNLLALIEGIERYRATTRDDLHLVLIGSWGWKSRNIKKKLWQRDVRNWVHPMGYINKQDLPAVYRSAKALVWPSIYEGFGLPVLEAMASGTPVITTHTSSLPELTGSAAIHIDPFNSEDIRVALTQLLHSNTLQEHLSREGNIRAKMFSWDKTAQQTVACFEQSFFQ
jgi:glycosyltransferase involved in cell wall biosynthesis